MRRKAAFDHLTDICSVDYPEDQLRFEVVYHLHSLPLRQRLRLKTRIAEDDPTIASVTGVWKGAEFLEREVYDMMGIHFSGHPDLRRILMPEDYAEGYPLRKDFPTEGRGWRSQFDFIPRFDEPSRDVPESEVTEQQRNTFGADAWRIRFPTERGIVAEHGTTASEHPRRVACRARVGR